VNHSCPRHPRRIAARRCYLCHRAICYDCEHRAHHHLFCSASCARRHAVRNALETARGRLGVAVPTRWALTAITLALLAPTLWAVKIVDQLASLASVNQAFEMPRGNRRLAAAIDRIAPGPDGVTVEGTSEEGGAVFLFAGDRFVAVTAVHDGRFRFERVHPAANYRVGGLALSPVAAANLKDASVPGTRTSGLPLWAPDLTRGSTTRREVVLSFDAGSSDRGALEILDTLRARGIRTTIFLTGEFIRKYPDIARRIAADGHEAGNHTDDHPHLTTYAENGRQATRRGVTREFLVGELERADQAYRAATGREMAPVWRAPFGEENAEIRTWAAAAGWAHVGWTQGIESGLDSLDWVADPASPRFHSSESIVRRLLSRASNGGIILMHLGTDREHDPVAAHLSELLDGLTREGFRLARATDFLSRSVSGAPVRAAR
jgi:peptidoglycan/xylan/chitin deacetylase (PgdA/CDA1 family)